MTTKIALALVVGHVLLSSKKVFAMPKPPLGSHTITRFWQNDPRWGSNKLGYSSTSIGNSGCLLTAIVICRNALLGTSMTPGEANSFITPKGGFVGNSASLNTPTAARLLGVRCDESDRIRDSVRASASTLRNAIDNALARSGLAIVHVDKDAYDGTGQHFVVVHTRNADGSYLAADPANASDITLKSDMTGQSKWGSTMRAYTAVGVAPVYALDGGGLV